MEVVLLFALLTVSECGGSTVKVDGLTSQDATLSCKYNIKKHGALSVCWGRGNLPNTGCSNTLVSTDGVTEGTRASSRYQLLGPLGEGDVSLTILNLTEADAGRYGCRVEVAGLFNDEKHHFDLIIERASTRGHGTETGSDVTGDNTTGPMVALVQITTSVQQPVNSLQSFIGNTVRVSFITFIPALLLTAAYRVWRSKQRPEMDRRLNQSEEEEEEEGAV